MIIFLSKIKYIHDKIYNYNNNKKSISQNLKVCVCTLAKLENRYIREFVQHYENYGVDKIFLYDNNDIDGENFEEVINDYIVKGFVEIFNWRGEPLAMFRIMNDCYKNNYHDYDWFLFYEIDEHIYLYDYKDIKLFLSQSKFNHCQEIYLNLVCHTDNNNLYYEEKPLAERFPKIVPKTKKLGKKLELKSIIRGHINNVKIIHNHLGDLRLKSCNNSGFHEKINSHFTEHGDYQFYYINHYYCKSTEEFITKITKGDAMSNDPNYINLRIAKYFEQSDITIEKINMIEKKTNISLDIYRKMIQKTN